MTWYNKSLQEYLDRNIEANEAYTGTHDDEDVQRYEQYGRIIGVIMKIIINVTIIWPFAFIYCVFLFFKAIPVIAMGALLAFCGYIMGWLILDLLEKLL